MFDAPPPPGAAWAIGNFDGAHRGHQALFAATRAAAPDAPFGVLTFEPHPRQLFRPDDPPFRLSSAAGKRAMLHALGVDHVAVMTFDPTLSAMAAADFAQNVLIDALRPAALATGAGFRFGRNRQGDAAVIAAAAARFGAPYVAVTPTADADGAFSSTRIRAALQAGDVAAAARILGQPWTVDGVVAPGDQRGRTIGFPTINLPLGDLIRPQAGVYVVQAQFDGAGPGVGGVANLGARPTVGGVDFRLEAHLFDFDADVYGRRVVVSLLDFVRPERTFDGLDALKAQIAADADAARRALAPGFGPIDRESIIGGDRIHPQ